MWGSNKPKLFKADAFYMCVVKIPFMERSLGIAHYTKNLLDLNAKIIICLHFNEDFPINLRFSMEKAVLYKRSMLLYG